METIKFTFCALLIGCAPCHAQNNTNISLPLKQIKVTSNYGFRTDPLNGKKKFHQGIDLKAVYEPAYSTLDGTVEYVGYEPRAGRYVKLSHGNHITVTYCHLSKVYVKKGDPIRAGQMICLTGRSGRVSGPHLHFVVKYNNKVVNPALFLTYIAREMTKNS